MTEDPGHATREECVKKLAELIKDIEIAMLTTRCEDGSLRSRPMATQQVEFDGDLWFFTAEHSAKSSEVEHEHQVNVAYASPENNRYVSVSGTARLVHDKAKAKELWNPIVKAYFPKGLEDPELALLRVQVDHAEYWDAPGSKVVQMAGFLKGIVTGQPPKLGEHEKVKL